MLDLWEYIGDVNDKATKLLEAGEMQGVQGSPEAVARYVAAAEMLEGKPVERHARVIYQVQDKMKWDIPLTPEEKRALEKIAVKVLALSACAIEGIAIGSAAVKGAESGE